MYVCVCVYIYIYYNKYKKFNIKHFLNSELIIHSFRLQYQLKEKKNRNLKSYHCILSVEVKIFGP